MDVSSVSIEEKKNQWSLLGRQGTATALVLLCLLLSHQRSLDPHFPALEAEPSSSMGSHRGRRSRNICNLILHAASLPTDVHPHGFLQPRLCWAGESLSSNCHIGTDPAPDAIIKLKFSSPLLLGLFFFYYCTPVVLPHCHKQRFAGRRDPLWVVSTELESDFFPLLPLFQPLMQKRCSSDISFALKRILMNLQVAG